ncbi:PREDICTED: uncharacterized protein LOC109237378 [Nicotiana attenuata]|uniref:uncharacterized protein LOC109237378 n=1 Tax=Nicotiana attenuata TaxID=49451 RepID=UPI0009056066|nr:PREDICTED: uncharacterized protein LOC109237378 [Nicotiana attenuata]
MTVTSSTPASSTYVPDPSGPLFIHPSDVPSTCLVQVPFSGIGFGGWKRNMIVALSAKNKIAFIDGTCSKPADDAPELRLWNRCNNMVISCLKHLNQLEKRYGTVNGTKVFEIKKELASNCQGSLDIASYFNKLKKLWDELAFIRKNRVSSCNCAAKSSLQQELEEDKVYQFLMGLNETYVGIRGNLLMMQPLPSLDTVYNILLQDESQRHVNSTPQFNSESASFNANASHFPKPLLPPPKQQYNQRVAFDQKMHVDQTRGSLFCRYCKKPGHLIDKCYKLHGFPSNFKFTKSRRTAANATNVTTEPESSDGGYYNIAGSYHSGVSSSPEHVP